MNNYSFPAWFSSITTLIALPVVFLLRPNMDIDEKDASIEENSTDVRACLNVNILSSFRAKKTLLKPRVIITLCSLRY